MQSGGKSYIPLPHKLSISKSVINVKNKDEKGFSWSVLASLYPQRGSAHKQSKYKRFINSVDMSGISYYVHPTDMTKFEKQSNISVTNTNVDYFDYTSTTSLRGDVLLLIWLDRLETVAYLDTRLQSQKYCFVSQILSYLLDGHNN
jgi:hypothetical protein